jgi:hypothetical protein
MLEYTRESIYGIAVYTFTTTHNEPYQLSFEENLRENAIEVSLCHLMGKDDSAYCPQLFDCINRVFLNQPEEEDVRYYFNLSWDGHRKELLLNKFVRWVLRQDLFKVSFALTKISNRYFVEAYLVRK